MKSTQEQRTGLWERGTGDADEQEIGRSVELTEKQLNDSKMTLVRARANADRAGANDKDTENTGTLTRFTRENESQEQRRVNEGGNERERSSPPRTFYLPARRPTHRPTGGLLDLGVGRASNRTRRTGRRGGRRPFRLLKRVR